MKKSFRKNIIREIIKSWSRFAAILSIVALGVGFLAGLMATTPDMTFSADKYYDDTNTMDIRIVSTMGLNDKDLAAIREIGNISDVTPAYSVDVLLSDSKSDSIVTKIHSIDLNNNNYQNQVILIDGKMPEKAGEGVIEHRNLLGLSIGIGDKFKVSDENIDIENKLSVSEIEIVGIVQSAQYLSVERERSSIGNGTIGLIMYSVNDSFSYDVYTDIYVTVKGAKELNTFSDKYEELIDAAIDEIELISEKQIKLRYDEIIDEANSKLDDAKKEYNENKEKIDKELKDSIDKINEANKEITGAETEIANGYKKLADGQQELDRQKSDFETQIAEKQKEIEDGKNQIAYARQELASFKKSLDEVSSKMEELRPLASTNPQIAQELAKYDAGVAQYNSSLEDLNKKEQELTEGEKLLNASITEADKKFALAQNELTDSKTKLEDAQKELMTAKEDLEKGIKEYNDGKKEAEEKLQEAVQELSKAENDIKKLELPEWYIMDRNYNLGYASFVSNAEKVEAIAKVFPIFFFLVAALVALTTMTRMVEEERIQIGTLKALGYSKSTIAFKYLLYAGLASILGSIIGLLVGFKLFPSVIWNAYKMMYSLPPLITQFNLKYALMSSLTAIFCTLGATLSACYSSLMECPASLMLPRAPKAGKRVFLEYISPIWKRLKFTHKVTARNLIRYKKRFFMTVIGVAGCTALLLTGFGLRDSIGDIMSKQFAEIFKYNLIASMKNENVLDESKDFYDTLLENKTLENYTAIHQESAVATANNNKNKIQITISSIEDESKLKDFITLQDRKTKKPIDFTEDTVIVTEKLAERLELGIGDKINLELNDGKKADFTIAGIAENYVTGYVYIPDTIYEEAYDKKPNFNLIIGILPNSNEKIRDEISTSLLKHEGINAVSFTDLIKDEFDGLLSKVDYIVIVLIVSAGLLAFIVLYNLTNINITERQKEIATIKVLGFYDKEVFAYVFRETIILSLIGTIAGLIFGIALHTFVVRTAEVDAVMFGRTIYPLSYIISALMTMFFSLAVNVVMIKKIKKIDMVESMKANE